MNLSCCLYQVQREAFGIILDSQLHASAALFLNNARACDHPCVLFAVIMDYFIHCFIHQFCLQLVTTSCGFAVNSSYRNIIDYWDNSVRISQNIAILFRLLHRLIKNTVGTSSLYHHKSCCVYSSMTCDAT